MCVCVLVWVAADDDVVAGAEWEEWGGEGGRGGLPAVHARAAWEARPAAEHRTRIAVLGRGGGRGRGGGGGGIVRSFFVHLSSGAGLAASRLHSPM